MYAKAAAIVSASDFYGLTNRWVFECIDGILSRGEPADLLTVVESLQRNGKLEEVAPATRLLQGAEGCASVARTTVY